MNKIVIFTLGAAVGSLLTWKLVEKKYKKLADEEIQSVIDKFNERKEMEKTIEKVEVSDKPVEKPMVKVNKYEYSSTDKMPAGEYDRITKKLGYELEVKEEDGVIVSEDEEGSIFIEPGRESVAPYVISPEEFGELEYYDSKSWTLYSDLIITDEEGSIVVDAENCIGDALEHFGEFEDDSVHVRNENLECDYEIIKVEATYEEINRRELYDASSRS